MTRWRRSLFGYLSDLMLGDEPFDASRPPAGRRYEPTMSQIAGSSMPPGSASRGYMPSGSMSGGPQGGPPQEISTAYAVSCSFVFADEVNNRKGGVYPGDAVVRLSEQLRSDYLAFLGYLHDPNSSEPVRQVALVNELMGIRISPQQFFKIREENLKDPQKMKRVPLSIQYFVKDDLSPTSKNKAYGMSLARFVVNTFRDLGLEYIAFGGISELEGQRVTEYIGLMNEYMKSMGLYYAKDPLRSGGKADPSFGLPGAKSMMPDADVDMTVAASYFEDEPPKPTAPWCIDASPYPDAEQVRPGGIDFPSQKKGGNFRNLRKEDDWLNRDTGKSDGSKSREKTGSKDRSSMGRLEQRRMEAKEARGEIREDIDDLMSELDQLIGLDGVKKNLNNLINVIRIRKIREDMGLTQAPMSLHLVFSGNPGTGKTTVARLLAKIYRALGVVEKGQLVEVDRAGLVEGYVGQTAQKTQEVIDSALGGVLFIDEAYTLTNQKESGDYGQEAVDTLLKRMEDDRDSFIVIVAGYTEPMEEFLESNPGLRSRFNKFIEFEDYSAEELNTIFVSMCERQDFHLTDEAKEKVQVYFQKMVEEKDENFANAREVRNFFERCIERQANRLVRAGEINRTGITTFDVEDVTE